MIKTTLALLSVATAVPETETCALMLAGLVLVASATRRRVVARAATPDATN